MVSAKKLLIILFGIFLVFSLFLLCLDLADYKPEEVTLLPISNNQVKTLSTMEVLSMTTYNIGYASLDDKQSFYRHGGLNSRATSENSVLENLNGVVQIIDEINPDFLLFQEVDINSSRSYRVNQLEHINMKYPNYTSFYGKNYDVPWVPIPILKPMGKVESGIATLSRHNISEAYRFSLPGEVKWPNRLFEPDRCFIQARYNIGNGVELIVINIHLSAFNNEGSIRQQQLRYLKSHLEKEYKRGSYIIVGGDWNHNLPGTDPYNFPHDENWPSWLKNLPDDFDVAGFNWAIDTTKPTVRTLQQEYSRGYNFLAVTDGFLISDNIEVLNVYTGGTNFKHSDHNPVTIEFVLKNIVKK